MVKECARKCSRCGNDGHNSRTCNGKVCLKLFGVNIVTDRDRDRDRDREENKTAIQRSVSLGNLPTTTLNHPQHLLLHPGYVSDTHAHSKPERKKGVPWTEEEHQNFLSGLKVLGKGDWVGISKKFVHTKNATQVASHAQKYFLRQVASVEKKKRRSSLFDMPFKEAVQSQSQHLTTLNNTTCEIQPQVSSYNVLENPSEACTSSAFPLKNIPREASIQPQVSNLSLSHRMEWPSFLPMPPTCGFQRIPNYVVGPWRWQRMH